MSTSAWIYESTIKWAEKKHLDALTFKSTESTNDVAKSLKFIGTGFQKLILAEEQSQGRGRGSATWISPSKGTALLSTWCFGTKTSPQPILSPLIGLAVYRALKNVWPDKRFSLKAPNDIYLREQKLAGILIESVSQGEKSNVYIGIGLNALSSPNLETAISLVDGDCVLNEENWVMFLEKLFENLCESATAGTQIEIGENTRCELLAALNEFPHLTNPYIEVLPNGSLKTSDETVSWNSL